MLSFVFVASLVGAAAAQLADGSSSSVPVPTITPSPTADPSSSPAPSNFYQAMPYAAYQNGGYKSLQCGYGYAKQSDGSCSPESWYSPQSYGCYGTTIINNNCYNQSPYTVTMTETQTSTYTMVVPTTVTMFETKTRTNTELLTQTQVYTSVEVVPTTKVWVSTEVIDNTKTLEHTLTATATTMTDMMTQTVLSTVVLPTTYVSTYVSTQVVDKVFRKRPRLRTATMTQTMTDMVTMTATSTVVVPTTYISTWKQTQTIDNTKTLVNTVTSTVTDNMTMLQTSTYMTTATATQTVAPTGLYNCLGKVSRIERRLWSIANLFFISASPNGHWVRAVITLRARMPCPLLQQPLGRLMAAHLATTTAATDLREATILMVDLVPHTVVRRQKVTVTEFSLLSLSSTIVFK
ncbi:hypothetical protein F5887DRAFT_958598 [Amanita rubescens]|nr:hypothetical protein F5887DRAFT_958598 [Amanita rubescens]